MVDLVINDIGKKETIKNLLVEFMEKNNIGYNLIICCGCERICLDFNSEDGNSKKYCCNTGITIATSSKDVCRIYPNEILYIAIEKRKSVIYLTNKKIETNYPFNFWKNILDLKTFAQPHNSYLVNMMYVEEVTKDFVILKYKNIKYQVYTSSRKLNEFKKKLVDYQSI